MTQQLVRYEAACAALAECKAIDEVKSWADKAAAMQAYGRMAKDKTMEVDAAEIRLRAERRLGEMLAAQKEGAGLNKGGRPSQETGRAERPVFEAPTLAQAGISKDLSSRAQKLAAVPPAEFEAEVGQWRKRVSAEGQRVTHRLEKAGERAQKNTAKRAEADQIAEDAHGDVDLVEELESAHREIESLTALVAAATADDLKAEAIKWRRAYDHALRQQSEAMDRAKAATDREAWVMRQLRRCGKAIGEEDPAKIAALVEAMARKAKEPA